MQEAGPLWDAAWRQAASRAACEQLLGLPETQTGEGLSLFAPLADEVDIVPLILTLERRGRVLFFPRFNRELHAYEMVRVRDFRQETIAGHYQVREPRPDLSAVTRAELIDRGVTWLVPGVAFDRSGARLGRGRGYYDRLLTGTQGIKIGVGFSWRLSARPLPAHERDVRMDLVVTESEVVRVQPGTACS
jgi:5-formyltetrahydrofolate cyclo-ligase